jgi:NTE family protein
MRVLNEALRAGVEACGPDHLDHINPQIERERGLGFQIVEECFVRPSEDIGAIAARHVRRLREERQGSWIGNWTFRALTRGAPEDEADFMSYLLFDGGYAQELMELARSDAARAEDELAALFSD